MSKFVLEMTNDYEDEALDADLSRDETVIFKIGKRLQRANYGFTTITPLTHQRVVDRTPLMACNLRDVFGWNRPFLSDQFDPVTLSQLESAGVAIQCQEGYRATVRFSSLQNQIFVHSAFPTEHADAVFFGPDTYRFARSIREALRDFPLRLGPRILDVGAGSGAGGLHAAALLRELDPALTLTDINKTALRFCRINASLNRRSRVQIIESDLYRSAPGQFDIIISNPPYLLDRSQRLYRHGGGEFGGALSVEIAIQGLERLAAGGRLLLYTGSAIVDGVDAIHRAISQRLPSRVTNFTYEEVDPDVFGEELDYSPYDRADRIAAVAAIIDVV